MEPVGKIIRHRKGVHCQTVAAQPPGNDQEVKIGADRQTDAGPAGIRQTGPVGQAGQAHQQVAGHIGSLRAERRDPGAQGASAQEIGFRVFIGTARKVNADANDRRHVDDHGQQVL